MQDTSWEKVKELLDAVLQIEPSKRQTFLRKAAISDEVKAEIESLIAFEDEAENLMNLSAIEFSKDFFEDDNDSNLLIGQQIGVYRIVREIGYGGMGAVYLAERNDGKFEQKVALKMLKREMNTAAIRRRFRQEGEILASLEHPNIARLLDTGTTEDKSPYLAMEYVEGLPIDEYCNRHGVDLNGRLDLFRQVCAAVNFAHRNLIVHRDLKPSNILVTKEGIPKLLDFGISKILSPDFEQINSATVTRFGAMTPSYASPEQLQRKSVTTATDIYSLGVILYELLCGHRPFEEKENSLKDIFQAVLETDPPLPSAKLEKDSKVFKTLSEKEVKLPPSVDELPTIPLETEKKTRPTKFLPTKPEPFYLTANSLRGDLDNIVMKALRKEPERRYSSAENLAGDIHRHQRGLPVTARPNTFSYRAEKFVKRNSLAVAVSALLVLAVVGGIAATLWQARAAQTERVRAEKRFNDVRTLANSFLFDFSPLIENLPGSTPAREMLVKKALEYLDNLSQESANDLELQRELAKAYEKVGDVQGNPFNPNIGDVKGAIESYEKAEKIRRSLLEKNFDDASDSDALSNNFKLQGSLHSQGGNYRKAGDLYAKALEIQEKVVEKNPLNFNYRWNLADIIRYNGFINYTNEQHKTAVKLYSRAIEIYEKLVSEQPENLRLIENYANVFVVMGESQGWDNDFKSAGINLQKGLDMLIQLRERSPYDRRLQRSLVVAYGKRGENLVDLEDYEKADECYLKSIELAKNTLALDPQDKQAKRDIALQYKRRATAFGSIGRGEQSIENMTAALKIFQELAEADPNNTENPYDIANVRGILGLTYFNMKQYEKALEISRKAVEEYDIALKMNPDKDYIKTGRAFSFKTIGRSYLALAEKGNRQENLQKAVENLQISLDTLKALNEAGRLNQFDVPNVENLEKQITEIKIKIGDASK